MKDPLQRGQGHVIYTQRLFGHRVHRAYVAVHMNRWWGALRVMAWPN